MTRHRKMRHDLGRVGPVLFDHNRRYHRMLLRHVPDGCRRALDVGCGAGGFARRLACRGITVDAVDTSPELIRIAQESGADTLRFWRADVTTTPLPDEHYDLITCLASLHHMPFTTVTTLRAALAPGGLLLILGCYRQRWVEAPLSLAAMGVNTATRVAFTAGDRLRERPRTPPAPVRAAEMTFDEVRRHAAELLPGSTVRRLLLWRYLLRFQR